MDELNYEPLRREVARLTPAEREVVREELDRLLADDEDRRLGRDPVFRLLRDQVQRKSMPEREWNPGDPLPLPPLPEESYPPDAVPLDTPPPSRWPVAEMLSRQLAGVKAERDALRAYIERDLGTRLKDALCGDLSTHAVHVVTHGPDQSRICPGRGRDDAGRVFP